MSDTDFNLLDELEQIRERESANLEAIEIIQSKKQNISKDFQAIRRNSLSILEAIDEIRARAEGEKR